MKIVVALFAGLTLIAQQPSLSDRIGNAEEKGVAFLMGLQKPEGYWSVKMEKGEAPSIAITCLAAYSIMQTRHYEKVKDKIAKAVEYIASKQDRDGAWANSSMGDLKTYTTSLAIMTLAAYDKLASSGSASGRKKYSEQILAGRAFLQSTQAKEGIYEGGMGYGQTEFQGMDNGKPKFKTSDSADLSNTSFAVEAMKAAGLPETDNFWKGVVKFTQRCQNLSENADPEWAAVLKAKGFRAGNDGGAYYKPDPDSAEKYGGVTQDGDTKVMNSYGSMTYSALKTYIYAGLTKDDPRVKALVKWICDNWTLDRHPGFPFQAGNVPPGERKDLQGLFYYYLAVARALNALGEDVLTDSKGKQHKWAEELAEAVISRQSADGSWANDNPRWWENDRTLVTSYALIVLGIVDKKVK